MKNTFPPTIQYALNNAHISWIPVLENGLHAMQKVNPTYLGDLSKTDYLPTEGRIFAAFTKKSDTVRYILIGESPYPRTMSAIGVAFMDGAIDSLWCEKGFSKELNRATSLRNFLKMLLVADGQMTMENTSKTELLRVSVQAQKNDSLMIKTLSDLHVNMIEKGFLMLNASLVFRPGVSPVKDALAWQPFMEVLLEHIFKMTKTRDSTLSTLILWGKIAERLKKIPISTCFLKAVSEHPYNLSFIKNNLMQCLFRPMQLLQRSR